MGNVNASSRYWSCLEGCISVFVFRKRDGDGNDKAEASTVPFSPELTMEILSWMPLKPLVQAQLVCKEWRALIQDRPFMEKKMHRTSKHYYWYDSTTPTTEPVVAARQFHILYDCDGLLLMKNKTTKTHFLWNPAARLVLLLPSPHIGTYGCTLSFVPATKNYKIISFFNDKDSAKHGCQVVTAGASMQWRQLPLLPYYANSKQQPSPSVVPAGGAVHRIVLTQDRVAEIMSVDVETELVTLNRLPTGIFRGSQSARARAIDCDGKLGFGVIAGQEVQLMVLEDYKNNRWCRSKQVIPLPFLKDEGFKGNAVILSIKQGEIWLLLQNENIHVYTVETGKIRFFGRCKWFSLSGKLYTYKPSFVTFEGMLRASAKLEECLRPRYVKLH